MKDFFNKFNQIHKKIQILPYLLKTIQQKPYFCVQWLK